VVQLSVGVRATAHLAGLLVVVFGLAQLGVRVTGTGTENGLFRHYWVMFKLLINLGAVGVLLLYMQTLGFFADIAANNSASNEDLALLRTPSVTLHSALAFLLLMVATVLAVYKPRGTTAYGRRKRLAGDRAETAQP
jgi:hypothetical protein